MSLSTPKTNKGYLLHALNINGDRLEVRENAHYRWFTLGGNAIQAIMNRQSITQVLMPVCQAMLLFTLWKNNTIKTLNLGMGGATFERYFSHKFNIATTSVEQSKEVIAMAKKYFELPAQHQVYCLPAEQFLQKNTQLFDVILCDIFTQQKNIPCIKQTSFYKNIAKTLYKNGVAIINIDPEDEQVLIEILTVARKYFSEIAIIEFEDYRNVVLVLSNHVIPDHKTLLNLNTINGETKNNTGDIDFSPYISAMHYLPSKNKP